MLRLKGGLSKVITYNQLRASKNYAINSNSSLYFNYLVQNNREFGTDNKNESPESSSGNEQRIFSKRRSSPMSQYGNRKTQQPLSGSQGGYSGSNQKSYKSQNSEGAQRSRDQIIDSTFKQKYGKTKSELLDSWLEMDQNDLSKECERMGVKPSGKHIENIQNLFEQLKKLEQEIEMTGGEGLNLQTTEGGKTQRMAGDLFKKRTYDKGVEGSSQYQPLSKHSPRAFLMDQEKARENLNEQLARILNKRKGKSQVVTEASNQNEPVQSPSTTLSESQQQNDMVKTENTENNIQAKSFKFSFQKMKKTLQERGPLYKEVTQQSSFLYTHSDSASIDKIFEMTSDQLDAQFKNYSQPSQTSLFSQMDLKQEDFEKLPGITKKKVLINMTGVRQNIQSDPNPILTETRLPNIKSLINFSKDNWLFLNEASKNILADQLQSLLGSTDSHNFRSQLLGNSQLQLDLAKIGSSLLSQDSLKTLKNQMTRLYIEEQELVFIDSSLENIVTLSNILKFLLSVQSPTTNQQKLQSLFYTSIRKQFNKKNVKQLTFSEQLMVLKVLPPVEGDTSSQTKSLHYLLLNEMMSPSPQLEANWSSIGKEEIMEIVERCAEMSKCRDISNKLRGCLLHVQTTDFAIEDFHKMFKLLADYGFIDKQGAVDVKLVSGLFTRRSIKTAANLINTGNPAEIKKFFDFYEFVYKFNPVTYCFIQGELKLLLGRAMQLAQEQYIPLQEMVQFAKTMVPSLYRPAIFFTEMIITNRENFKKDVDPKTLYEFVTAITQRAADGEYGFEHLQLSTSRIHRNFRPFTEKTIVLLKRILNDLTAKDDQIINPDQVKVINKILSNQYLVEYFFKSFDEAEQILGPVVDVLMNHIEQGSSEIISKPIDSFSIDFNSWIEQFQALSSIALLVGNGGKIGGKLGQELSPAVFNLMKQELFKTNSFNQSHQPSPIDSLFKLNKAILEFFDQAGFMEQLYQDSQVREIVTVVLESHFLNKKPFVLSFEKFKKNVKISKMIQVDTTQRMIEDNIKEIVHFMNYAQQLEGVKEIAREVCKALIPSSRSLVGIDLVNVFKMIDKYEGQLTQEARHLIINVAPNLMTIESQKIFDHYQGTTGGVIKDKKLEEINERLEKQDLIHKKMILKKYEHIYHQQPQLLKKPEASLSPLSYLMAEVIDQYSDEEVLMCLEILGSNNVENYHESFIKKLYERYQTPKLIDNMAQYNQKLFLKFAKHWPHFLKNNAMLNQLISLGRQSSTLAKQQSETLHILTKKNVLHPELMEAHLDTFLKMKDRERVQEYLQEYLHAAAKLGYTGIPPSDVQRLTQLFRRLHKSPEQVPSLDSLLDFLVVLALSSDTYHKDFDTKSAEFVESAIDYVERQFTGQETLEVPILNSITGEPTEEKIRLNYFKSIPSHSKIYNKVLVPAGNFRKKLNFSKLQKELEAAVNAQEMALSSSDDEEAEEEQQPPEEEEAAKVNKKEPLPEKYVFRKSSQDQEFDLAENPLEPREGEIEDEFISTQAEQPIDFVLREDIDAEMHAAVQNQHHKANQKNVGKPQKEKKIYERKASESLYSEELEFHQFRKKKLQDLDKKSKHLLLFSNINQLNFVDLNASSIAKAWSVLFHFRAKTFDSILYDEFESITMRNTIGKSKGHELFSKFYLKLIEASYDKGFRMHLTSKCQKTGWPIDISINTSSDASINPNLSYQSQQSRKQLALYFFLQEEVCLNAKEQSEEPLGLQKLMLKHLQSISDYKVEYVTENDFYMNKDKIGGYVEYLLKEKVFNQNNN